jgi:hypothetical protein
MWCDATPKHDTSSYIAVIVKLFMTRLEFMDLFKNSLFAGEQVRSNLKSCLPQLGVRSLKIGPFHIINADALLDRYRGSECPQNLDWLFAHCTDTL